MWHECTAFESQHNESRVYEDYFLCFGGSYDCQRTLVIRIAAITLASDSAITISGRAKGAAKASCGETVVQKGVFGESVSSLPP